MHGCWGACVVAGGPCVVAGGHAWLPGEHVWQRGHAWRRGCMHGKGGACMGYNEIRSMSGRCASYCNAFLLLSSVIFPTIFILLVITAETVFE